jgi:hypothetical protein
LGCNIVDLLLPAPEPNSERYMTEQSSKEMYEAVRHPDIAGVGSDRLKPE